MADRYTKLADHQLSAVSRHLRAQSLLLVPVRETLTDCYRQLKQLDDHASRLRHQLVRAAKSDNHPRITKLTMLLAKAEGRKRVIADRAIMLRQQAEAREAGR